MRVEQSVVIKQPVERVFAFISDIERQPDWVGPVESVTNISSGPMREGTTYTVSLAFMGRSAQAQQTVAQFEPNRVFSQKTTSGPIAVQVTLSVEPAEGGTRVNNVTEADGSGIPRLMRPMMTRSIQSQVDGDMLNLRDLLEMQVG